jgi:signal transduction histidine kinase
LEDEGAILSMAKGIQFTQELPGSAKRVYADASGIGRLLLMVLENAMKLTPAGGRIEMRLSNGAANAPIEIRDPGVGMDAKDLRHVFGGCQMRP